MDVGSLPKPVNPTIRIDKKETTVDLLGTKPEDVTYLCVYSNDKKTDLGFLREYPNVETLFVNGDFANVDGISELKRLNRLILVLSADVDLSGVCVLELKSLTAYHQINNGFAEMLTENVEYLELLEMRRITDLSFIEKAKGLKKLYLCSLPAVEKLPDFGKLPNLYGLKLYELHKLSGTKLADVLLGMERLEWAHLIPDRSSDRRYNVMENRLRKAGREQLLVYCNMDKWQKL